jgi:hypothetical protein
MRKLLCMAILGVAATPAPAGPISAPGAHHDLLREAAGSVQPVFWRAGGVTPGGTAWHAGGAGGYRWGGAYHPGAAPTYVHGYGGYHYGGYYRAPVPVATPWYHPVGTFAAGAAVGAVAAGTAAAASSAAAASAANTAAYYAQPPTVVNNYYYNNK